MTSVFVLRVWSSLLRERPEQDNRFSAVFDVKCAVGYCARTFDSYIFGGWIMSAPKNFGMHLQVYFLLVSYIPRGSRAVPFQVDGTHTHTHILGIYRFLSTTFFFCFVLFISPFFCASYMERRREAQDGSVPLDSSSRTTCGKKKRSISNAHTHTGKGRTGLLLPVSLCCCVGAGRGREKTLGETSTARPKYLRTREWGVIRHWMHDRTPCPLPFFSLFFLKTWKGKF